MVVEERLYTLHPGTVPDYVRLFQTEGIEIQQQILGRLLGYFSTEVGPLNQVIHLWGYESLEDRAKRRAQLGASTAWQDFVPKVRPLIVKQENKILLPLPFSPIR